MILKHSDHRSADIEALTSLIESDKLPASKKKAATIDLAKLKAGIKGEKEAAYEIDRLFGSSPDHVVIHDLRIEHGDQVAQIDHLIITRSLHGFICESKNFGEGLACNEHGEWEGFYKHRPFGIASPIHQVNRQQDILYSFFDQGHHWIPKKLGDQMGTRFTTLVLISNTARISRPKAPVDNIDKVCKIEALHQKINVSEKAIGFLERKIRTVSQEALITLAQGLASHHTPHVTDWASKYGIEKPSPLQKDKPKSKKKEKKKLICDTCGSPVTLKEARFCWFNKNRFGEGIYCRTHQNEFT